MAHCQAKLGSSQPLGCRLQLQKMFWAVMVLFFARRMRTKLDDITPVFQYESLARLATLSPLFSFPLLGSSKEASPLWTVHVVLFCAYSSRQPNRTIHHWNTNQHGHHHLLLPIHTTRLINSHSPSRDRVLLCGLLAKESASWYPHPHGYCPTNTRSDPLLFHQPLDTPKRTSRLRKVTDGFRIYQHGVSVLSQSLVCASRRVSTTSGIGLSRLGHLGTLRWYVVIQPTLVAMVPRRLDHGTTKTIKALAHGF